MYLKRVLLYKIFTPDANRPLLKSIQYT